MASRESNPAVVAICLFVIWALEVFVYVRLDYYVFRPGQLVHVTLFGGAEETYDARGMVVLKIRDDLFRHWFLGLPSNLILWIPTEATA